MPPDYRTPGVYIHEATTGARTIAGVATSITAFIGRAASGPTDAPTLITSFSEFQRSYGGLSLASPLSYAVRHYFDNGGSHAQIARVVHRDATGAPDESAPITDADLADPALEAEHRGLWLLDHAELVNLLCIPPLARGTDVGAATWNTALHYAKRRRAFLIVDPPATWTTPTDALYFPRITAADPLTERHDEPFAPSGAIAGVYARTDMTRGIWKAPAGAAADALASEWK